MVNHFDKSRPFGVVCANDTAADVYGDDPARDPTEDEMAAARRELVELAALESLGPLSALDAARRKIASYLAGHESAEARRRRRRREMRLVPSHQDGD
jgi:hypothetical protein